MSAGGDNFIGEIMLQGFNFAPRQWALCDGQLLAIAQNNALFSLLGTAFGGDGRTSFALPDLRGRAPKNVGTGAGLDTVAWGQRGGAEEHVLTVSQIPSHNHTLYAQQGFGNVRNSQGSFVASDSQGVDLTWWNASAGGTKNLVATNSESVGNTGGGIGFDIRNPYLGVYYSIAMFGIYPSRS